MPESPGGAGKLIPSVLSKVTQVLGKQELQPLMESQLGDHIPAMFASQNDPILIQRRTIFKAPRPLPRAFPLVGAVRARQVLSTEQTLRIARRHDSPTPRAIPDFYAFLLPPCVETRGSLEVWI